MIFCHNRVIINYGGFLSNHDYILQLEVLNFQIGAIKEWIKRERKKSPR